MRFTQINRFTFLKIIPVTGMFLFSIGCFEKAGGLKWHYTQRK
jgi:hypothetical protein